MDLSWALILIGAVLVFGYALYASVDGRMKAMESRIRHLSVTIKQLEEQGMVSEPDINDELRQLVREGKTVEAVKRAREAFGLSLLEAKQYVDAL